MKIYWIIFILIFLINLTAALDVEFSCPSEVSVNEEFSCEIDFSGDYDVKVDLLCDSSRCARIWNGEFWGSTYYFVKEFSEEVVRLKIVENFNGNCEGKLRLRKCGGSGYDYEESFSIRVEGGGVEIDGEADEDLVEDNSDVDVAKEIIPLSSESEVIVLNSAEEELEEGEVIYESKNEKIKNFAIYGFALFLIFVIVVLVVGR